MSEDRIRDVDDLANITSITLGGFQVFDEPTTIPLGRLTFLFGPNSAGKSAVEDGLVMLRRALENSNGLKEHSAAILSILALAGSDWQEDLRKRHWRRTDGTPDGYAPSLTMGLTATLRLGFAFCLADNLSVPWDDPECTYGSEIGVTFQLFHNEELCNRYTLAVDGRDILHIDDGERIGVDFTHPLLRGFRPLSNFSVLAANSQEYVSYENGWMWLWSRHARLDFSNKRGINRSAVINGLGKTQGNEVKDHNVELDDILPAVNEVLDYFNSINEMALGGTCFTASLVAASRRVPTQKDLTCLCTAHSHYDDDIEKLNLVPDADPTFQDLAESCLDALIGKSKTFGKSKRGLLDRVNRALSDHLFLERGYAIAADVRFIVDFGEFKYLDLGMEEAPSLPAIVQIHLVDAKGRRYSFEDVGSGLGYVLPVLCSIFSDASWPSISLIQQPELHLHPALQTALGDVFIESAKPGHQIIIETHSEHLLLRVLKRIRQTTQGKVPTPELSVKPDDVTVAYFEPSPHGVTTVKHLRISEDGEFLDRWPRGFFTERDDELFDE